MDPSWPFRYGHSEADLVGDFTDGTEDDDWDETEESDWKEECGLEAQAAVVIDCDEIKKPQISDYEELIERPISVGEDENAELDEAG